jgi:hypothetical protein
MGKQAISVTLDAENVTWLKGRAGAGDFRSVSDLLNRLIVDARAGGGASAGVRSVAGTIDVDASDPLLEKADAAVRHLYNVSVSRPLIVREARATYSTTRKKKRRG